MLIRQRLEETVLGSILPDVFPSICGGKMIRSRMGLSLGMISGVEHRLLVHAMAAVEMIHSASLVHDDVIDGGILRRGIPSFWVSRGTAGAVVLGDLLVCKALETLLETGSINAVAALVSLSGEMCEGEASQELLLRNKTPDWVTAVDIARRKTGSLFAFVGLVCGGNDEQLCAALRESGRDIGTAYQLADDLTVFYGSAENVGKSVGLDADRAKVTAATAFEEDGIDPIGYISNLMKSASRRLEKWPVMREAWDTFVREELDPILECFLEPFRGSEGR